MMKRILISLFFLFIPCAWSSPYPVIVSYNAGWNSTDIHGVQSWGLYIKQSVIDIGSAGDYVPPSGYKVALAIKDYTGVTPQDGGKSGIDHRAELWADGRSSISKMAMQLYNDGGKDIVAVTYFGTYPPYNSCVAYAYGASDAFYGGGPWSGVRTPGGCMTLPPLDTWCKIVTPEIVLDHGSISLRNAEGHSAVSSMDVSCISTMAVTFNLITDDKYVYLDDGKSEITVDNKPLKTKIDLPQGNSTLTIKDLLTGVTSEGLHTGSSVLVMAPY
ncbi:hypothetical protein [Franconibacter daqui]|uniref:hypothetical protein n=1 Tax=Franconibacter daqui TaxID=2047724 RepID=UPI00166B6369|nr:hypothetical protein [Franconibacter daqui]